MHHAQNMRARVDLKGSHGHQQTRIRDLRSKILNQKFMIQGSGYRSLNKASRIWSRTKPSSDRPIDWTTGEQLAGWKLALPGDWGWWAKLDTGRTGVFEGEFLEESCDWGVRDCPTNGKRLIRPSGSIP